MPQHSKTRLDAAGWYPYAKPDLTAEWSSQFWTGQTRPESGIDLPRPKRHPFGFLGRLWFWLFVVGWAYIIAVPAAIAKWAPGVHPHGDKALELWLAMAAILVGFAATAIAFYLFVGQFVPFRQVPNKHATIWIGIGSGAIGFTIAAYIESFWEESVGISSAGTDWLAGPVEETMKLLVPLILWLAMGRFLRNPVNGFLVVFVSASTLGALEGVLYVANALHTDELILMTLARPFAEIAHPLWTGAAAAVIWVAAARAKRLFTWSGLVAYLLAAFAHSFHDGVGSFLPHADTDRKPTAAEIPTLAVASLVTTVVVAVVFYYIFRIASREVVPPTATAENPEGWRPRVHRWGLKRPSSSERNGV